MNEIINTPIGPRMVPKWEKERVENMSDEQIINYFKSNPRFVDPFIVEEALSRGILWDYKRG